MRNRNSRQTRWFRIEALEDRSLLAAGGFDFSDCLAELCATTRDHRGSEVREIRDSSRGSNVGNRHEDLDFVFAQDFGEWESAIDLSPLLDSGFAAVLTSSSGGVDTIVAMDVINNQISVFLVGSFTEVMDAPVSSVSDEPISQISSAPSSALSAFAEGESSSLGASDSGGVDAPDLSPALPNQASAVTEPGEPAVESQGVSQASDGAVSVPSVDVGSAGSFDNLFRAERDPLSLEPSLLLRQSLGSDFTRTDSTEFRGQGVTEARASDHLRFVPFDKIDRQAIRRVGFQELFSTGVTSGQTRSVEHEDLWWRYQSDAPGIELIVPTYSPPSEYAAEQEFQFVINQLPVLDVMGHGESEGTDEPSLLAAIRGYQYWLSVGVLVAATGVIVSQHKHESNRKARTHSRRSAR